VSKFNRSGERPFPVRADLTNAGRLGVQNFLDSIDTAHRGGNRQIANRASFHEEADRFEIGLLWP